MNEPARLNRRSARYLAALAVAATPAVASARTPLVLPGWPVPTVAGSVHDGPDGGAVVIAEGFPQVEDNVPRSIVVSLRRNGTVAWRNTGQWGCGNCDDGPQVPGILSNGTYGPLGPEGDGAWGVDPTGSTVMTCLGVMLPDGTCVTHESTFAAGSEPRGSLVARRSGVVVWRAGRPNHSWVWQGGLEAPPLVVADGAGLIYTTIGAGTEAGIAVPSRLVALDASTGVEHWRVTDAEPVAALTSGVLVRHRTLGLVRYDASGTVQWSRVIAGLTSLAVRVDLDRDRAYLWQLGRFARNGQILALDATTGAELWRTAPTDLARLVDIRRNGTVLAAIDRRNRGGLRAIGLDGRSRWQFDTITAVSGAHALGDGTVIVTTEAGFPGFAAAAGLAWRIEPGRTEPRRTSVALGPRTFVTSRSCAANCPTRRDYGTVLRFRMPTRTTLRVRLISNGHEVANSRFTLAVPVGQSAARIYTTATRGTSTLEVRGQVEGRTMVHRFAVRIR